MPTAAEFVRAGNRIVNLAHAARAERGREGEALTVRLLIDAGPRSDYEFVRGRDAEHVWARLCALATSGSTHDAGHGPAADASAERPAETEPQ